MTWNFATIQEKMEIGKYYGYDIPEGMIEKTSYVGPLEHNLPVSMPRLALLEGLYYIVEVKDGVDDWSQLALVDQVRYFR